jgi:hypothetical protein
MFSLSNGDVIPKLLSNNGLGVGMHSNIVEAWT